jgi:hypothetical protein
VTKPHTPAHYLDGFVRVAFCKVCGAEGLKLLDDCQGNVIHTFEGKDLGTTNFNKALDEQN